MLKAKENLDVEIGEFITHSAEEGEPYEKGDGVAFKEFYQFPLTDKINPKVIARKIVKLGQRVQRLILKDSIENDPDEGEMLSHIITASIAAQSDL